MYLKKLELSGFKSFAEHRELLFTSPITAIVGPNGSGKSNVAEAFRFVLGEQSMKSMRTKRGEDLIWNGSRMTGRKNRALVTVTFDNKNKIFPVEYSEVSLSREVGRDGTNRYLVNGSQVRLKDVLELLASAKVGSSAHHIISQGEADRILSANPGERREMIEDALGLRIYQYKIAESARKLQKTEENLVQVKSLASEIEPHLKFLEKQVKRIEEARALRRELLERSKEYFFNEDFLLKEGQGRALEEQKEREDEIASIDQEIETLKRTLGAEEESASRGKVLALEEAVEKIRKSKSDLDRELGRIEGMVLLEERQHELDRQKKDEGLPSTISYEKASDFFAKMEAIISEVISLEDIHRMRERLEYIKKEFADFLHVREGDQEINEGQNDARLSKFQGERKRLEGEVEELEQKEEDQKREHEALKQDIEKERGMFREAERSLFEKMTTRNQATSRLRDAQLKLHDNKQERNLFESDLGEFSMLLGREVLGYETSQTNESTTTPTPLPTREERQKERRELERHRIKVEEMGGSGEEVVAEYENLKERKDFLTREVADLERTKDSLHRLIDDLEHHLNDDFKKGLGSINKQFQEYFEVMFGGGKVSLSMEKAKVKKEKNEAYFSEEGEEILLAGESGEKKAKPGLEIDVELPKKRVKGIQMLSGGERSLTSVALLFAVSQVNPPPFLVLDETDAALDEANSCRYGEMLEKLSEKTQLIIITHNRETMSRARVLYGITVGRDAVSKVLSVKLEDAQEGASR